MCQKQHFTILAFSVQYYNRTLQHKGDNFGPSIFGRATGEEGNNIYFGKLPLFLVIT